jgi:hypothetical protein
MKKILFVGLFGLAMLTSAEASILAIRYPTKVISTNVDGWIVTFTSDESTGAIKRITIYDSSNELLLVQECLANSYSLNLSGWKSGSYRAHIEAQHGVKDAGFVLP